MSKNNILHEVRAENNPKSQQNLFNGPQIIVIIETFLKKKKFLLQAIIIIISLEPRLQSQDKSAILLF